MVVFKTASDIEARVVRGLLESHGIASMMSSGLPRSIFRWRSRATATSESRSGPKMRKRRALIEGHRVDVPGGRVVALRNEFSALDTRLATFSRCGLLEHALNPHVARERGCKRRRHRQRIARFLGDAVLGFAIADLLFRRFPDRDEGWKSKIKAALVSTTSWPAWPKGSARRSSAARAWRRKDRRPPQQALLADGTRRDRRHLPGRRRRTGDGVHRPPVRGLIDEARAPAAMIRDFKWSFRNACSRQGDRLPEYR